MCKTVFASYADNNNTPYPLGRKIGNINIENNTSEKMLGINVDYKLNFNKHLD